MREDNIENLFFMIEKRFQTTMIGSLARVENYFGFLWGHNKDMISIEQSDNRQIWQDLREDILDHCNHQLRGALVDIKKILKKEYEQSNGLRVTHNYKSRFEETEETGDIVS